MIDSAAFAEVGDRERLAQRERVGVGDRGEAAEHVVVGRAATSSAGVSTRSVSCASAWIGLSAAS